MSEMNPVRHQQVMSILADALKCDTGERDRVLAQSCQDDPTLRQEVEHLLRRQTAAQGFMEESLVEVAFDHPQQQESLIGKRIGPYLILDEIGRGGMGTVYLAKRIDDEYEKRVAIKLITRGMDTELIQRRFRTERQILANLEHQNIARLYDGGTTEDGRAFLVMEYVSGEPIDLYADRRSLSTTDRLKLFLAVCDAVQYAHRSKVIHRDLKPSNILVNSDGVPKLLDFGIAKFLSAEPNSTAADATTSTWRILTPEYASPEQIRGEAGTAPSDIYSLGAVLYELLTGHRPRRPAAARGSSGETPSSAVTREPEKPSAVISSVVERPTKSLRSRNLTPESVSETRDGDPERLRRNLRGDLDNIVLMALRNDPRRRYASVEDFSDDIRRHLQRHPVRARKDSLAYRGRRFFQRNRTSVISTAVVAVLCLLVGLALNFFTRQSSLNTRPPITSIAVMPFVNVSKDHEFEYLTDGFTAGLINSLSRLPNLNVPGHNSVVRYKGQALDLAAAERDLNVKTLLRGRTTTSGDSFSVEVELIHAIDAKANQVIWSKRFDGKVSDVFSLQQQVAEEVLQSLGLPISAEDRARIRQRSTRNSEAYRRYLKGNYLWNLRTIAGLSQAVDEFQAAINLDPNYSLAYSGLANSYSLLGAYLSRKPHEVFPKAKIAALKAVEVDEKSAEAYTSLGLVSWLYDWDWAAADKAFRRSIELNPGYVTAHHWYGLYLGEMGRFEEAIASEKRALELDPLSVYVTADLGRVYFYARRYDESLVQYRKATEMNPGFSAFAAESAQLYEQLGMYDEYLTAAHPMKEAEEFRQMVQRGREGYLRKVWSRLWFTPPTGPDWFKNYGLARTSARLGENRTTFELLNRAYELRDHMMTQLKVDPAFDSLRSDPRFVELLRRMNLAP